MNLLRKAAQAVIATFWMSDAGAKRYFVPGGGDAWSGETVTERAALGLSTVWACVNLLSGLQGSMPIHMYRTSPAKPRELADDHPVAQLIRVSPNADQSAFEFWQFMFAVLELRGNAYARKVKNGAGEIIALEPVESCVGVSRTVAGGLQYDFSQFGKSYQLGSDEMLHVRGFMPTALGGLSTLEYARNTFGSATAAERTIGETFRNGLKPSGVLAFKEWLTGPQRDIAENRLIEKFAGSANSGKPMILEGGVDWKPLMITPVDAQFLESRGFSVEEMCRYFGVPPFMIGYTQKTTSFGNGVEQQTLGFVKWALTPRLSRVESALARSLLSPEDRARGYHVEYSLEGLLRGDAKSRAEFYRIMVSIGAMTVNEVRDLENRAPIDGGDVARVQMQNVPLTQVDAMAASDAAAQAQQGQQP